MSNACIKPGLTIAILAALIGGCSTWTGPSVAVEDRSLMAVDRPKAAGGARVPQGRKQAPAQSLCDSRASNLIHPVHFNPENRRGQCPLLSWEIHTGKQDR